MLKSLLLVSLLVAAPLPAVGDESDIVTTIRELPPRTGDEIMWLARCIYSESNRSHEQRLVAWVVRNRVETNFRGRSYREAVLNPAQFSAFNEPSERRRRILNLTLDSRTPGWEQALRVAYDVYSAPAEKRPFPTTTRHFYSPISMEGDGPPVWTGRNEPISSATLGVLPQRFKFYDGVDAKNKQRPAMADRRNSSPDGRSRKAAVSERSNESRSLDELRQSVRRRVFQGQINRPSRPTVKRPSRPDRER